MVNYNPEDFSLNLICDKLKGLQENRLYYLYGLKKENPAHIQIKWKDRFHPFISDSVFRFADFCNFNNLEVSWKRNQEFKTKINLKDSIHIGLNYKLRKYPEFCSLLVKSFIFLREGKIEPENFNIKMKIKNMPNFEI